jgi:hypothetical protein
MAAGMAAGMAAPASADVSVTVTVSKTKDITVTETITKLKEVTITALVTPTLDGAAEAQAIANVRNSGNFVGAEGVSYDAELTGIDTGSVNDNTGLTQVNQAAGNMQNQGNLVAAGLANTDDAFVNSQAEVDQVNTDSAPTTSVIDSVFDALIDGSITGNAGVTQVNQDAGNMNNQTNAVALAANPAVDPTSGFPLTGTGVTVALSEAALGQENSGHNIADTNNIKTATIVDSISDNHGITQVNQSVGMFANQANVVSVGAAVAQF